MIVRGTGNMGDVTSVTSKTRWTAVTRSRISNVRVYFKSGTGTATLTVQVDARAGNEFDRTVHDFGAVGESDGTIIDVNFDSSNAPNSAAWIIEAGDAAVLNWTDPGTSVWIAEVVLVPA